MKWLIVNTEAFSAEGIKGKKLSLEKDPELRKEAIRQTLKSFYPDPLTRFLSVFADPLIVLDESSKIKTNTPTAEKNKSTRCRVIKSLNDVGERVIMTGTLKSKTPLNVYDQYGFLDENIFPEDMHEFAERYCIMVTIHVGRGRRVIISEKDYKRIRKRLVNAWRRGGEEAIRWTKASIFRDMTITEDNLEWIMSHKKYTPFINQDELIRRIKPYTMFVKRSDVFDIKHEYFVTHPITRYVDISAKAKKIGNELVEVGFSDRYTLGKAPALELMHRMQDLCNGFEPVEHIETDENGEERRTIEYVPFKENPKLDGLLDLMDEIDWEENQIAVFCTRLNLMEAIEKRFTEEGITFARYEKGNEAEAERQFRAGEVQVFLSTIAPSAYGLNCLAQCDYSIYACVDNGTEAFYQSQHRLLRGQLLHAKFSYILAVRGSVEEKNIRCLALGSDLISNNNDKTMFKFAS